MSDICMLGQVGEVFDYELLERDIGLIEQAVRRNDPHSGQRYVDTCRIQKNTALSRQRLVVEYAGRVALGHADGDIEQVKSLYQRTEVILEELMEKIAVSMRTDQIIGSNKT